MIPLAMVYGMKFREKLNLADLSRPEGFGRDHFLSLASPLEARRLARFA